MRNFIDLVETSLTETPIENFSLIGDFSRNSSFHGPVDRAILQSPKARDKIIRKWMNVRVPFNMIFVNHAEAKKQVEIGRVDGAEIPKRFPKTGDEIERLLSPDAVNVIYTNNRGAERVQVSAWILAHRFGHVVADTVLMNQCFKWFWSHMHHIEDICFGPYTSTRDIGNFVERLLSSVGTFKSARDGQISRPNEFVLECLAQFMLSGAIRFNSVPSTIAYGEPTFGRYPSRVNLTPEKQKTINLIMKSMLKDWESYFAQLLEDSIGEVFIM